MKVVVTGGCGYIGSHVARAFKFNGDQVYIIDQVYRKHTLVNIDNYMIADFASAEALSFIRTTEPDVIVHCAGTSLVGPSMTNPAEYYDNNISKLITMLSVIKDMPRPPLILFSSSASVYGEPDVVPIPESSTIKPISVYGNTKAMVETILADYGRAYGIDSVCFRYFNAAGAMPLTADLGQEPGATHIIARILEAQLQNKTFSINGSDYHTADGTCVRDYVHVWDIARAHVMAMNFVQAKEPYRDACNLVFNLGTGQGISNREIVDYVDNKYGLLDITYGPRRAGDPATLVADASEANDVLGWRPVHSTLEEIVDSAYQWYCRV